MPLLLVVQGRETKFNQIQMKKMLKSKRLLAALYALAVIMVVTSCQFEQSTITGMNYNDPKSGGFEKVEYVEQETGPGLVLVQGGRFTMGRVEQDVLYDWNNVPRTVTVSSYYMDETEITNFHWLEYEYWLQNVFGPDFPEIIKKMRPDTLVWREKLAYNEPYVLYYLRHPSYRDYPVVGVNWLQASDFCSWRTDRVNETILIREGLLDYYPNQINEDNFNTEAYFYGQYESGKKVEGKIDMHPNRDFRNIKMEDGILLPRYRLPTEAEWEYAAYSLIGNTVEELVVNRKIYPWTGSYVRMAPDGVDSKMVGEMMANFVRAKGDYMGVAGHLNDNADITAPAYSYWPNDFGLYNMAGNVSEWVMDVYRPLTATDGDEFRSFRGNVYETKSLDAEGNVEDKYDIVMYDVAGIRAYLTKQAKLTQRNGSDQDNKLLNDVTTFVEKALEDEKNRKFEDASQKVQDAIDVIKQADVVEAPIAAILIDDLSEYVEHKPGQIKYRNVTPEENIDRRNYIASDNINYMDGDQESSIFYEVEVEDPNKIMYEWGKTTLINDRARVYKGGSWRDRAMWMNPGTRRYLDERQSTATIGFRCAMTRVGTPKGLGPGRY